MTGGTRRPARKGIWRDVGFIGRNYKRQAGTNNPTGRRGERSEAVFFEVRDDKFAIAALVFEGLLTLALFFGFFLALYA
jgi:hypothetical protein